MEIRYKFFNGGDENPFRKELDEAYSKITEEREIADPNREKPIEDIFPRLESWPDYVLANSLFVFWQMERAVSLSGIDKAEEIEEIWQNAKDSRSIGEWLIESEADESEKALCYYMASLYNQYNPNNKAVDFRLYISEELDKNRGIVVQGFSLEPYE